jgi:hypothetical protein
MIGIDLHKRLFLLVPGEENSPRFFLTMDRRPSAVLTGVSAGRPTP